MFSSIICYCSLKGLTLVFCHLSCCLHTSLPDYTNDSLTLPQQQDKVALKQGWPRQHRSCWLRLQHYEPAGCVFSLTDSTTSACRVPVQVICNVILHTHSRLTLGKQQAPFSGDKGNLNYNHKCRQSFLLVTKSPQMPVSTTVEIKHRQLTFVKLLL